MWSIAGWSPGTGLTGQISARNKPNPLSYSYPAQSPHQNIDAMILSVSAIRLNRNRFLILPESSISIDLTNRPNASRFGGTYSLLVFKKSLSRCRKGRYKKLHFFVRPKWVKGFQPFLIAMQINYDVLVLECRDNFLERVLFKILSQSVSLLFLLW
jgi:hypothetical protein